MKTIIHRARVSHGLMLLLMVLSPGRAQAVEVYDSVQQAMQARATWEEHAHLELRAIGEVGGEPVAMLDIDGDPVMVIPRLMFLHREVKSVDLQRMEVTLEMSGKPDTVLPLTNPRPVTFPVLSPQDVERLLQPNVRRRREMDHSLPIEVLAAWKRINRDAREAILMNYLREGVVCGPFGFGEMPGSGFRTDLFAKQRGEIMAKKRVAFLASLSVEQRAEYTTALPAVHFFQQRSEADRAELKADVEKLEARKAAVVKSLNPEQRRLYDQWWAYIGG